MKGLDLVILGEELQSSGTDTSFINRSARPTKYNALYLPNGCVTGRFFVRLETHIKIASKRFYEAPFAFG